MSKEEQFIKKIAPLVEDLADLCRKYEVPFIFLAQVDDKSSESPCKLSLSSDLDYNGVSKKLCDIQDDISDSFISHEPIVLEKDKQKMN